MDKFRLVDVATPINRSGVRVIESKAAYVPPTRFPFRSGLGFSDF